MTIIAISLFAAVSGIILCSIWTHRIFSGATCDLFPWMEMLGLVLLITATTFPTVFTVSVLTGRYRVYIVYDTMYSQVHDGR